MRCLGAVIVAVLLLAGLSPALAAGRAVSLSPSAQAVSYNAPAQATPEALNYARYVAALHTAYDALNAAAQGDTTAQAVTAQQALAVLPPSPQVAPVDGGTSIAADLGAVRAALEREPPDGAEARTRLRALLDLLDPGALPLPMAGPGTTPGPGTGGQVVPPPGPPINDATAQARLDEVLRDPRFHYEQGGGLQKALADTLRPVIAALLVMDPLLRALLIGSIAGLLTFFILLIAYRDQPWSRGRRVAQAGGVALVVAVLVAGLMLFGGQLLALLGRLAMFIGPVGGLLAVLLAGGVLLWGLRRGRGRALVAVPVANSREAGWTAAQAAQAADKAATAGDYRQAVRYRYLALMLHLDEADRLPFDRALTNLEHLRRAPTTLREALRPLVQTFDRIWYGGRTVGEAEYRAYAAGVQAVEAAPADEEARA